MNIKQVLNNNVVMAKDEAKGEVIVVGTGIGYMAKKGDAIDQRKIQQVFVCSQNKKFIELLDQISPEMIELVEKVSSYAKLNYEIVINDDVFFLLTDHINYAVKRLKEGLELDNPFLTEIRQFFGKEYQVGLYAKDCIKEMFDVTIPEAEIGYICMHLIASEYHQERRSVSKVFEIMDVSVTYIKEHYLKEVKEDSLAYNRLVTHIKFFAQRYAANTESEKNDTLLDTTINEVFKKEKICIDGLSGVLENKFGKQVTQSEKNYIVLHLRNCINTK